MRWTSNSNDRNLQRSKKSKFTQTDQHREPLITTTTTDHVYLDVFSDIGSISWSSSDNDEDGDSTSSVSSLSAETSATSSSSESCTEEIHSYSETDFFGEIGCSSLLTSGKDLLAEANTSETEISDFEADPLSDCGTDFADKFAEILTKFDDILRDIGFEASINLNNERDIIKPCGKVYPVIQAADRSNNIDDIKFGKIEKCDSVSGDDGDVLVELLRHAWFVLMLYILVKTYFITI